jgi:hypothetical protein
MGSPVQERLVTAVAIALTCLLVVLCLVAGFGPWGAFIGAAAGLAAWALDRGPSGLKRLRTTDGDVARVHPDAVRAILDRGRAKVVRVPGGSVYDGPAAEVLLVYGTKLQVQGTPAEVERALWPWRWWRRPDPLVRLPAIGRCATPGCGGSSAPSSLLCDQCADRARQLTKRGTTEQWAAALPPHLQRKVVQEVVRGLRDEDLDRLADEPKERP